MNTSDILNQAADLIEQRGWSRGGGWPQRGREDRPLCLEGGIMAALGETYASVDLEEFWACPAYRAVMGYLERDESLEGITGPVEPLWRWNDDGNTGDNVIATLREAAQFAAAVENAGELVSA